MNKFENKVSEILSEGKKYERSGSVFDAPELLEIKEKEADLKKDRSDFIQKKSKSIKNYSDFKEGLRFSWPHRGAVDANPFKPNPDMPGTLKKDGVDMSTAIYNNGFRLPWNEAGKLTVVTDPDEFESSDFMSEDPNRKNRLFKSFMQYTDRAMKASLIAPNDYKKVLDFDKKLEKIKEEYNKVLKKIEKQFDPSMLSNATIKNQEDLYGKRAWS